MSALYPATLTVEALTFEPAEFATEKPEVVDILGAENMGTPVDINPAFVVLAH